MISMLTIQNVSTNRKSQEVRAVTICPELPDFFLQKVLLT